MSHHHSSGSSSKSSQRSSATAQYHRLAAPERVQTQEMIPVKSNGTPKTNHGPKTRSQKPGVEIRDSRRRRSVRPRSEKSRDISPGHTAQRISYPPTPLSDRTKSFEDDEYRPSRGKVVRFQLEEDHDAVDTRGSSHSSRSLQSVGAWCEPTPPRAPLLPEFQDSKRWHPLPTPPMTPSIGRLDTPDLAPMAFDTEFCPCCGDEQDRVNETWYLAGRDKYDVQLDEARAYIASVRARVDRLLP